MFRLGCIKKRAELVDENILCVIPFTYTNKRTSIVVQRPQYKGTPHEVRIYTKGAPDIVLDLTTHALNEDG